MATEKHRPSAEKQNLVSQPPELRTEKRRTKHPGQPPAGAEDAGRAEKPQTVRGHGTTQHVRPAE
jgi:hypothetical protein